MSGLYLRSGVGLGDELYDHNEKMVAIRFEQTFREGDDLMKLAKATYLMIRAYLKVRS